MPCYRDLNLAFNMAVDVVVQTVGDGLIFKYACHRKFDIIVLILFLPKTCSQCDYLGGVDSSLRYLIDKQCESVG